MNFTLELRIRGHEHTELPIVIIDGIPHVDQMRLDRFLSFLPVGCWKLRYNDKMVQQFTIAYILIPDDLNYGSHVDNLNPLVCKMVGL